MITQITKFDQRINEAKKYLAALEQEREWLISLEGVEPTYDIGLLTLTDKDAIGFHTLKALPGILELLYSNRTFIVKHSSYKEIATIRMNGQHNRFMIKEYLTNTDTINWLTEDNWMKYATQYPAQWFLQN